MSSQTINIKHTIVNLDAKRADRIAEGDHVVLNGGVVAVVVAAEFLQPDNWVRVDFEVIRDSKRRTTSEVYSRGHLFQIVGVQSEIV